MLDEDVAANVHLAWGKLYLYRLVGRVKGDEAGIAEKSATLQGQGRGVAKHSHG